MHNTLGLLALYHAYQSANPKERLAFFRSFKPLQKVFVDEHLADDEHMPRRVALAKKVKRRSNAGYLLVKGNDKVGRGVFVWNLPVLKTCPGSTALCRSVCYADWGYFRYPRNRELNESKLKLADSDGFVEAMRQELEARKVKLLRIHSSGDFHTAEYIRKWVAILKSVPGVTAWAYTRSWRIPELLVELKTLARLPNVHLQFSADAESGLPPMVKGVPANFLQVADEDIPDRAGAVKLIWRTRQEGRQPAKRMALPLAPAPALVCPNYQGTGEDDGHKVTCATCRFCLE